MFQRLLIVGGDNRARMLASLPEVGRMWIDTLGLLSDDDKRARIGDADAMLFPYPYSIKDGAVPQLCGDSISARDVLSRAKDGAAVIVGGGMEGLLSDETYRLKGFKIKHYADDALFLSANTEISAEAAVYETMKRLDRTMADSVIAVTGYGRFGRAVARKLICLGATVWVAARREEQRVLAASDGAHPLPLEELHFITPSADALLNTIPARVIDERALTLIKDGSPILELASAPFGADRADIERHKLRYELLPALPASYAPLSAARALLKASMRLLMEEGI